MDVPLNNNSVSRSETGLPAADVDSPNRVSLPEELNSQNDANISDSSKLPRKKNVFQSLKSGSGKTLRKIGNFAAKHPLAITGVAVAVGGVALMGACLLLGGPAGFLVGGAILGLAGGAMIGASLLGSSTKKDTAANTNKNAPKEQDADVDVTEGLPRLGLLPDLFASDKTGPKLQSEPSSSSRSSQETSKVTTEEEPEKEAESASQPTLMNHVEGAGRALMVDQGSLLGSTSAKYSARASTPEGSSPDDIVTDAGRQDIDNESNSINSRRSEVEAQLEQTPSGNTDTKAASLENTPSTKSEQSTELELELPPLPPREAPLPPLPPREAPPPPPPPLNEASVDSSRSKEGDTPFKPTAQEEDLAARLRQRRAHLEDEEGDDTEISTDSTQEETPEMTQPSKTEDVQDMPEVKVRPERGRNDLLKDIRQGANLRHVEASEKEKPAAPLGDRDLGAAIFDQMKQKGSISDEDPDIGEEGSENDDEDWAV